jgi:uncharacterized protein YecT (DUF1311 family)
MINEIDSSNQMMSRPSQSPDTNQQNLALLISMIPGEVLFFLDQIFSKLWQPRAVPLLKFLLELSGVVFRPVTSPPWILASTFVCAAHCNGANSQSEALYEQLLHVPEIKAADTMLGSAYAKAKEKLAVPEARSKLKTEQLNWLKKRNTALSAAKPNERQMVVLEMTRARTLELLGDHTRQQDNRTPFLSAAKPVPALEERIRAADAQLNNAYQHLRGKLDTTQKQQLLIQQRNWIRERDALMQSGPSSSRETLYLTTIQRIEELKSGTWNKTGENFQHREGSDTTSRDENPISLAIQEPHLLKPDGRLPVMLLLDNGVLATLAEGRDVGTSELKLWGTQDSRCLRTVQLDNGFQWIFPSKTTGKLIAIADSSKVRKEDCLEVDTRSGAIKDLYLTMNSKDRSLGLDLQLQGSIRGTWGDTIWDMHTRRKEQRESEASQAQDDGFTEWTSAHPIPGSLHTGLKLYAWSPQRGVSAEVEIEASILAGILGPAKISPTEIDGAYIAKGLGTIISFKEGEVGLLYSAGTCACCGAPEKPNVRRMNRDDFNATLERQNLARRWYSIRDREIRDRDEASLEKQITIHGSKGTYRCLQPLDGGGGVTENPDDTLTVVHKADGTVEVSVNRGTPITVARRAVYPNLPVQLALNHSGDKILVSTRAQLIGIDLQDARTVFSMRAPEKSAITNPLLSPDGAQAYYGMVRWNEDDWPGAYDLQKIDSRSFESENLAEIGRLSWGAGEKSEVLLRESVFQGTTSDRSLGVFVSNKVLSVLDLNRGMVLEQMKNPFPGLRIHAAFHQGKFYVLRHEDDPTSRLAIYGGFSKDNNQSSPLAVIYNSPNPQGCDGNLYSLYGGECFSDFDISGQGGILAPISSKYGGTGVRFFLDPALRMRAKGRIVEPLRGGCRANWIDAQRYFLADRESIQIFTSSGQKVTGWPKDMPYGSSNLKKWEGTDPCAFASSSKMFGFASPSGYTSLLKLRGDSVAEVMRFYLLQDGSPIFTTPENFYATHSPKASAITFTKGVRSYPLEQFDLRLNRPDVILERLGAPNHAVMAAKSLREKRLKRMGVTEEMLKPDFHLPEVRIVGDVPSVTDQNQIQLHVIATDETVTLERLRIYVNNVPVNGREGEIVRSQTLDRTIPVNLAAGRNKVQVSALNSAGAESFYATVEVSCTAQRPASKLYAVALGVSKHEKPEWCLKYAAKDAADFIQKIKGGAGPFYSEVKTLIFIDKEVKKESVADIRNFLSEATIDDAVVIFLAGHGLLDDTYDYFFGTADVNPEKPAERGMAYEQLNTVLTEIPCLRKALLMDTCHAGEVDIGERRKLLAYDQREKALKASSASSPGAVGKIAMRTVGTRGMTAQEVEPPFGRNDWYEKLQDMFVDLRRGSGATVIASSQGLESAFESSQQSNGLFTYALLEALDGRADTGKDGRITVGAAIKYVKRRVTELTKGQQTPNLRGINLEEDFVLGAVR